jgi:hypothetical protein
MRFAWGGISDAGERFSNPSLGGVGPISSGGGSARQLTGVMVAKTVMAAEQIRATKDRTSVSSSSVLVIP